MFNWTPSQSLNFEIKLVTHEVKLLIYDIHTYHMIILGLHTGKYKQQFESEGMSYC